MGFFAEMEVPGYRVLKKVDEEVSGQDQQRRFSAGKLHAFWQHLQQCCSEHEPRAKGHKVAQIATVPVFLNDDGAAQPVGGGGGEAEQNAESDWVQIRE